MPMASEANQTFQAKYALLSWKAYPWACKQTGLQTYILRMTVIYVLKHMGNLRAQFITNQKAPLYCGGVPTVGFPVHWQSDEK